MFLSEYQIQLCDLFGRRLHKNKSSPIVTSENATKYPPANPTAPQRGMAHTEKPRSAPAKTMSNAKRHHTPPLLIAAQPRMLLTASGTAEKARIAKIGHAGR